MRKAIVHLKKTDPVLRAIIERVGPYRIRFRQPVFETLVRSIIFQQLSGKAASTIYNRLAAVTGEPIEPGAILALPAEHMRALGLSRQKIDYVTDLAARTASGELRFDTCAQLTDDEVMRRFTAVKGIGVWTVQMFLMFALERPDVLPTGDLGLRAAVQKAYGLDEMPSPKELEAMGEPWAPYRTVASWYLWRSLEESPDL
jgi:DNA-3-methyladenine glycosylase II